MRLSELDTKEIEYSHLNLDIPNIDFSTLRNPFPDYRTVENYLDVLQAIRDPKNFYFTCKHILNVEPITFQLVILEQLWHYPFPMIIANRGASKSFTVALYYMLRALITQGCKIVISSATFRQAKYVFEYCESIWYNAPVYRDICGENSGPKRGTDLWTMRIGASTITAIPLGNGEKIRGLRGQYVDVEEFGSVPEEVYEIVLKGFTSTAANPQENIKNIARFKKLQEMGQLTPEIEKSIFYKPNQIILSGTAGFDFQHFAKYWKKYHAFISSKGDPKKLEELLGSAPGKGFSDKDYTIIRIPVGLLPEGMMDEKSIDSSRATMDQGRFMCEYEACFAKDSTGFFRRSIIEACTTNKPIELPSGPVQFYPQLSGNPSSKYIMGVDPASEADNFCIYIVEVCVDHVRAVYCWTINRKEAFKRFTEKKASENTFYAFIAKKIRSLMKLFQIEYIGLDSGGGGIAVLEALRDNRNLEPGELPIHPIRQDDPMLYPGTKDYGYDDEPGLHIIDMVYFGKTDWLVESNHGLRRALENRVMLFPHFDNLSYTIAENDDEIRGRETDTLQDVIYEIEQSKEELSCITHTTSLTGKDRWETPTTILQGGKKVQMRKDRYSAMLIAHSIARRLLLPSKTTYVGTAGGFASDYLQKANDSNKLYTGADWYVKSVNSSRVFGQAVNPEIRSPQQKDPFRVFSWQY